MTVNLPDDIAERLAAEAARRGQNHLAAELLAATLPAGTAPAPDRRPKRRLAFGAIGASGSSRGGADADDMLAEGFGRD